MNNDIKPGYLTTELWVAVVTTGLALAIVYGVLNQEQAAAWKDFLMALIPLLPGIVYVVSRTALKIKTNSK